MGKMMKSGKEGESWTTELRASIEEIIKMGKTERASPDQDVREIQIFVFGEPEAESFWRA